MSVKYLFMYNHENAHCWGTGDIEITLAREVKNKADIADIERAIARQLSGTNPNATVTITRYYQIPNN